MNIKNILVILAVSILNAYLASTGHTFLQSLLFGVVLGFALNKLEFTFNDLSKW